MIQRVVWIVDVGCGTTSAAILADDVVCPLSRNPGRKFITFIFLGEKASTQYFFHTTIWFATVGFVSTYLFYLYDLYNNVSFYKRVLSHCGRQASPRMKV